MDLTLGQLVWRVIRAGWGPRLRVSMVGQRKYDYLFHTELSSTHAAELKLKPGPLFYFLKELFFLFF